VFNLRSRSDELPMYSGITTKIDIRKKLTCWHASYRHGLEIAFAKSNGYS